MSHADYPNDEAFQRLMHGEGRGPLRFTTLSTFEATGRGTVHVVEFPSEYGWPRDLQGKTVELDGRTVRVTGVEMPAVSSREFWEGRVGLCVVERGREPKADASKQEPS